MYNKVEVESEEMDVLVHFLVDCVKAFSLRNRWIQALYTSTASSGT